ncbi:MAG: hypothetical protein JJ902_05255 [Roseibium sp.]|nr:hypothetical protein [Roseibium sp.]
MAKNSSASVGHNSLSEEDRKALAFMHKSKYAAALAEKKKADADFKNVCKVIKAELGDSGVQQIKDMIELDTATGETAFKEKLQAMVDAARWSGLSIGTQGELFDVDRRSAEEKATEKGYTAGVEGKSCVAPYDAGTTEADAWIQAWHAGQKKLFAIQKLRDGDSFDAEVIKPANADDQSDADDFNDALADGDD